MARRLYGRAAMALVLSVGVPLALAGVASQQPGTMPEKKVGRMIAAARELAGVSYQFGGRLRNSREGIDCQGLVFYAAERICRCGWKSFSTKPTRSVNRRELGVRVPGLDPVSKETLEDDLLMPGDVIWLVDPIENPAEPSIARLDSEPVWVWHVGLYTGDGDWIHADAFSGRVVEEDLLEYLFRYGFAGIFVTRMEDGPAPATCRRHRRMRLIEE